MIVPLHRDRILRVAVDGVDGAGKTTFADKLAQMVRARRPVIRASVDGFHQPKTIRYRLGRNSPQGFFLDSYNYPALKSLLLDPLSLGGSARYRTRIFDVNADSPLIEDEAIAPPDAVLLFDGIFLHRPELLPYWDFSIYLDVWFEASIPRGAARGPGFGSPDPQSPENQRYIKGQKLYLDQCNPLRRATVVIDNNDLNSPRILST
jgi:uridine kinase